VRVVMRRRGDWRCGRCAGMWRSRRRRRAAHVADAVRDAGDWQRGVGIVIYRDLVASWT
jgi:hypothetical protein